MELCGNDQVLISAHMVKLMSIKRVSGIRKINELRNLYDQVESVTRTLHSFATDNYGCFLKHILKQTS